MREKKLASKLKINTLMSEETAQEVNEETAALELEKLQRKVAREERRKRREIEQEKQKKAILAAALTAFCDDANLLVVG